MTTPERQLALNEKKSEILRMLAGDTPIDEILAATCRAIERAVPERRASIVRCARDGSFLHGGVAPAMAPEFVTAIEGMRAGSWGTAAFRKERVIVHGISADPLCAALRLVAQANGIDACWSEPIISRDGEVIGTFTMYRSTPGEPDAAEIEAVEAFSDLARLALRKERSRKARIESNQRLTNLMRNIPGMVLQWSWPAFGPIGVT